MEHQIKGIYLIERISDNQSDDNRKYYIGMSATVFDRWNQHCTRPTQSIDEAIKNYGLTSFTFRILEVAAYKKDLKKLETKWIEKYKEEYGEDSLYNISETKNENPNRISPDVKKKIKNLFKQNIGQSIYAISEAFGVSWKNVLEIRTPLLKENGLKYDKKVKQVVSIADGRIPNGWNGGQLTDNLAYKVLELRRKGEDVDRCLISLDDLNRFLEETENGARVEEYVYAPKISSSINT